MNDFAVFILTHRRHDNVRTFKTLRKQGYTGDIVIIIDDEDPTLEDYLMQFDKVEIFSKKEIVKQFDRGENFTNTNSIVFARNACFDIAEKLGYKYFMELDDDYQQFDYRIYTEEQQKPVKVQRLDSVFAALLRYYKSSNFLTIAMAQGGDFIGGKNNQKARTPTLYRKCMNSFICSTERKFNFVGTINEDVNTYTRLGALGKLLCTIPMVSLTQVTTQRNKGGMTDFYLDQGTYVKSFYSILWCPSCVTIKPMGDKHMRLHHSIKWNSAVPKIISEKNKR